MQDDAPPPAPDATGDAPGGPAPAGRPEEHRFPCDQCGADMRFDAAAGALICDHCGNRAEVEAAPGTAQGLRELDFRAALEARLPEAETEETRTVHCPNCGAVIEMTGADHAGECPFCATPVVIDTGTHRRIKPRGVAPFVLDEAAARQAMTDWLGRLWFAPNGLRDYARKGRRMDGIYVPYWTFDADTRSSYSGERGTAHTVTRTVRRNGKSETVTETRIRWRPKSGRVKRFFDDVLVLASTSLPKRFTDALQPWDLGRLEPYRPEYLAGYRAEGYTVALTDGYEEARAHMDAVILRDVKFDIGGDAQRVHRVETEVSDVTFKHVLLPVWMAAYKFRGKTYRFVVNGQSGRVQGERPWSPWKIAIAVVLGAIVAIAVGYFANGVQ